MHTLYAKVYPLSKPFYQGSLPAKLQNFTCSRILLICKAYREKTMKIVINNTISIDEREVEFSAIRAQGAGGQNVNKVNSAVHLRFDIAASSLPEECKQRLMAKNDSRITEAGIIIIKAQQARSQQKNRDHALSRLIKLIASTTTSQKKRRPTKPTKAAKEKRLASKNRRSNIKQMRKKVEE